MGYSGNPTLAAYEVELTAQGYVPNTVRSRLSAPRLAAEHNDVEPWELTRQDVLDWLGHTRRSANTRVKYLGWLRQYLAWAGLDDVTADIRRPRIPQGVPKPVSEIDLRQLIVAAAPGRQLCWVLLGAYCGLRSHESAKVALEDLEPVDGGDWNLRVLGKGGQWAVLPCPQVVVDALTDTGTTSGRFWPAATSDTVQGTIRRLGVRAGVDVTSHQLRHRYGTAVYRVATDLLLTQQLMRHASPATTAGYAKVAGDAFRTTVDALPGAVETPLPGRPHLRIVR